MTSPWNLYVPVKKRKIFVSYFHGRHQSYYDLFARYYGQELELFKDNSLDRARDSDDPSYIMRHIRERCLSGTSTLVVLCGQDTDKRKYVDWEIQAALAQRMSIVAVKLPDLAVVDGGCSKPPRLQDNIDSGYAHWIWWESFTASANSVTAAIEAANGKSKSLIENSRPRKIRNG